MVENTLISIIVPCRNEEKHIEKCINSVMAFSLPNGYNFEVLVIDGGSTDRTLSKLKLLSSQFPTFQIYNNPKIIQSSALNIGVLNSKGKYILRIDAHSIYPKNYLEKCLLAMIESNADNVGGVIITQPGGDTYGASVVQALTTHPFGVGNSGFRTGMASGEVDTVPYGFFKKSIFNKIGFFDERLVRAQDYEFNKRIIKSGGRIWMDPNIQLQYYNKPTFVSFILKQLFKEAPFNAYMWYLAPYTFTFRHAITGLFAAGIIWGALLSMFFPIIKFVYLFVIIFYITIAISASIQQAFRFKTYLHVIFLPLGFFSYHFLHGLGVIGGLFKLLTKTSPVQREKEPWEGYGHQKIKITQNNQ